MYDVAHMLYRSHGDRPLLPWCVQPAHVVYAALTPPQSAVDFGYILGRDPKPLAPPVKVCKEMIDAMGGVQSVHYQRFKSFCFTAFSILRKSANLSLNLVTLMVDASIPHIKQRDVHEQVLGKFCLEMTEEQAIEHFERLLNDISPFTVVLDRMHDWAQYWRS